MPLSFIVPNRTALMVADESLYIYAAGPKGPRLVESVSWDAENFEQDVANIISKDCGGKPVLILNDMVEQHYRKERVMKGGVGVLDKQNMLKRKLNVAFPNYPVRAAFALKEKAPKTDKKSAADIYIFAAIPESKQFQKTLAAVNQSLASIAGFCLLPIESSDMVKTLYGKLQKKGQPKAQWVVFVGQHKNGGLRQIVIKNGELALTRMTPVVDSDEDVGVWAGEVHQEFNATMSYLSRFGFQQEDGLHVIAIANPEAGEALHGLMDDAFGFTAMTAAEAASMLGVPAGSGEDLRYADPVQIAWIARKTKFILPMKSAQVEQVSRPRQIAVAASFILICGIAFFGYQLLTGMGTIAGVNSEIDEQTSSLAQLNVQYQAEVQRKEALGFDVRLVQSSIAVYDLLEKNKIKALPFYKSVGDALGRDMRVDKITVKKPEQLLNINIPSNAGKPVYEASMQMTYPSTADIDRGNQEVKDLAARLKTVFKDNDVQITKLLKDYEYSEGIVVETGDLEKRNVSQDFVAEIVIKGPPEQQ